MYNILCIQTVSGMDVVSSTGCEDSWISRSAPSILSPCRRAASFPYFGGDHTPLISSALKIRSTSESEGLNRFRLSKFGSMTVEQLRYRLQTQAEETSDCESTSSDSDGSDCEVNCIPIVADASVGCEQLTNTVVADVLNEDKLNRRCVRFADDCGCELYSVKIMTEPTDYPPKIPSHVIRRYRGESFCSEDEAETSQPASTWVAQFKQPASDYMKFRDTVDKGKVALENLVVKNDISHMVGTVKVANIGFEKKVFIRFTSNGWKTFLDRAATFQPSASTHYDTFAFDIEIPRNSEHENRLEFCVCYVANEDQYWDSNNGSNYVLIAEGLPHPVHKHHASLFGNVRSLDRNDAYRLEYDNWTKFASWKQLSTDGPYW